MQRRAKYRVQPSVESEGRPRAQNRPEEKRAVPTTFLLNFFDELQRRVPVSGKSNSKISPLIQRHLTYSRYPVLLHRGARNGFWEQSYRYYELTGFGASHPSRRIEELHPMHRTQTS